MEVNSPRAEDEFGPYFVPIGASGSEGPSDLRDLLEALLVTLHGDVLVVLHPPSDRISHLRQVLACRSKLPVTIPDEDQEFRVGVCYIGKPAAHLSLAARSRVHLIEGAHNKHRNETVDLLFASAAAHASTRAIGVVLRDALSDGSRGLSAIHLADFHGARCARDRSARHAFQCDGPIDFTGSIDAIVPKSSGG